MRISRPTFCTNYIPIHARAYINTSMILYTRIHDIIIYTRLMRNNSVNLFIPRRLVYIIIYLAAAAAAVEEVVVVVSVYIGCRQYAYG